MSVIAQCNVCTVGGNSFATANEVLFYGRCETSRTWVVKALMPPSVTSGLNVTSLSYQVREVSVSGGVNQYTRAMNRLGNVFILRGREVSIIPTGSAASAFQVTATCDVSQSPANPTEVIFGQGQNTIGPGVGTNFAMPPFACRVEVTSSGIVSSIDVNFLNDANVVQSSNAIATPTSNRVILPIPHHAISLQVKNNDANVTTTTHYQWTVIQ